MKGIVRWVRGPVAEEVRKKNGRYQVFEILEYDSLLKVETIVFEPGGGAPAIFDFYEYMTWYFWANYSLIPSLALDGEEKDSDWKLDIKDVAKKYFNLRNIVLKTITDLKQTRSLVGNKRFKEIRQSLELTLAENILPWSKQLK